MSERVIIIMPAYNAEKTLEATIAGLPTVYDDIILCDDASGDKTYDLAQRLGINSVRHPQNRGYGGNQKTLFRNALLSNADIIVMVHPDNQYDTSCLPRMIEILRDDPAIGLVIGSRMEKALLNNMPRWKYISNKFLTLCQNIVFQTDFSEFHSGLRAYRSSTLVQIPYEIFSDGFVFDSEIIAWLVANDVQIAEVPTHCYYLPESSSLGFSGSLRYGLLTLGTLGSYLLGNYKKERLEKSLD
jgi:glycosyltransferase involved in cell wall biosynthesis